MKLPPPLVILSPGDTVIGAEALLLQVVDALAASAAQTGSPRAGLLLREPELEDGLLLELASALRARLGPLVWLGLHDRIHLVPAAQADGVHLGFRSLTPAVARTLVAAHVAVGFSSHAGDGATQVAGSDYRFLSPLHPVEGKREPLGYGGLEREGARFEVPFWALGGITAASAQPARQAGASGLVVRRAVFSAPDPTAALEELLEACSEFPLTNPVPNLPPAP